MILKLTNKSKNFYAHLGNVFGSREIERITGDRFYDDDEKIWYIYYDKGNPVAFVSIKNNVIKNVWSDNEELLTRTLKEVCKKEPVAKSVVPIVFKDLYVESGFTVIGNGYKNFIEIKGDIDE